MDSTISLNYLDILFLGKFLTALLILSAEITQNKSKLKLKVSQNPNINIWLKHT